MILNISNEQPFKEIFSYFQLQLQCNAMITHSADYNFRFKSLDTASIEPTNQDSIKVLKVLIKRISWQRS